jgi:hypothetical protein
MDVTDASRSCSKGYFRINSNKNSTYNLLSLTTDDCGEGNSVQWYEFSELLSEGPVLRVSPQPKKSTTYRAYCKRTGCSAYYTYEATLLNDFKIEYKTKRYAQQILEASNCSGIVTWSSSPESTLNIDCGGNCIKLPETPTKTITYTATCHDVNTNQMVQRAYTIPALAKCFAISAPTNAAMGEMIELKAEGCSGSLTWEKIEPNQLVSVGSTIKDVVFTKKYEYDFIRGGGVKARYNVKCTNPSCAITHEIQQIPCDFTVKASKESSVKIGEEIFLTSSGCPTGKITWKYENGQLISLEKNTKIYPLEPVTIIALCEGSDCDEQTIKVSDFITTPPKALVCEELKLNALQGTTQNNYIITATGCEDGTVSWQGPGLSTNPAPTGKSITVFVSQESTYFAQCDKGWTKTQAQIKLAPIELTLSANPITVEKSKTTALTVTGCTGGTVVIKDKGSWIHNCASLPCRTTSAALNKTTTFTATCTKGALVFDKSVEVKVIAPFTLEALPSQVDIGSSTKLSTQGCQNGNILFTDGKGWSKTLECKSASCSVTTNELSQKETEFTATCLRSDNTTSTQTVKVSTISKQECVTILVIEPTNPAISLPYPKGTALNLKASGCGGQLPGYTIKFFSRLFPNDSEIEVPNQVELSQSAYFKAVCYKKNAKCGESTEMFVTINPAAKSTPCSNFTVTANLNQLGIYPAWKSDKGNIWFSANVNGSENYLIQAQGCGGSLQVLLDGNDVTSTLITGNRPCICSMNSNQKITIICKDQEGKACATKIITFNSNSASVKNARTAAPEAIAVTESTNAQGCAGTYPLDKIMEK